MGLKGSWTVTSFEARESDGMYRAFVRELRRQLVIHEGQLEELNHLAQSQRHRIILTSAIGLLLVAPVIAFDGEF
jgi:hypothetical protein